MTTRRNFLKNTTMLAAGLGVSPLLSSSPLRSYQKEEVINGKVRIAVIGVGMGCRDLQGALTDNPWVHCVGMCDVNKVRLEEQLARFKKDFPEQTVSIKAYTDFREVLANKEIDGVIIATPDHWHPYIFAEALKAGKAIYVEKPVGNSISECNAMMDFQKKYKGVVTTGLWQTSQRYFRAANEILKSGVLGDVYKVQLWLCQSTNPRPSVEDSEAPSTLDYDMWLGPAPERPFNNSRFRGWRGFWDYGGGQQTDWGVHWIDSAFDGLKHLVYVIENTQMRSFLLHIKIRHRLMKLQVAKQVFSNIRISILNGLNKLLTFIIGIKGSLGSEVKPLWYVIVKAMS